MDAEQLAMSAARVRRSIAEGNCPHWDYDDEGGADLPCCRELAAAERAVHQLRRKAREARMENAA